MIKIAFLTDHSEAVPILAQWFRAQWPDYYAERTLAAIEKDFYAEANRHSLPVRLVAFVGEELAGTIVLRERALENLPIPILVLGDCLSQNRPDAAASGPS